MLKLADMPKVETHIVQSGAALGGIDSARTWVVVASKSGGTVATSYSATLRPGETRLIRAVPA